MSDVFQYQCESCMVVGELDEHYDTFDCPQCGGIMRPLNAVNQPAPYELDEDATIAIPRDFATSEAPPVGVKVAQAVDLGFGGILSKGRAVSHPSPGGARVATPVSTGLPVGVAPAPAAPTPVPVQPAPVPVPAPAPIPVAPQAPAPQKGRVVKKSGGAPKKAFSLGKKPAAASQSATQVDATATRAPKGKKSFAINKKQPAKTAPAQSPQQPVAEPAPPKPTGTRIGKGKKSFALKKKSPGRTSTTQTSQQPAVAPAPQQPAAQKTRSPGFKIQKKGAKKAPKKVAPTAPQPVKTDTGPLPVQSIDAARTQSAFPNIQPHQHNPHAPAELESAAIDQAAKFAALQAELESERAARLEAEQRATNDQAQLVEQAHIEEEERRRQEEERAQILAQEAAEQAKIEAQQQAMAQMEAERKEIERQAEELKREREELDAQRKELSAVNNAPEEPPAEPPVEQEEKEESQEESAEKTVEPAPSENREADVEESPVVADSKSEPEEEKSTQDESDKNSAKENTEKKQEEKPEKKDDKLKSDSNTIVKKKKGPRPPGSKPITGQKKPGMTKTGIKRKPGAPGKPGMTKTGIKKPGMAKTGVAGTKTSIDAKSPRPQMQKTKAALVEEMRVKDPEMHKAYMAKQKQTKTRIWIVLGIVNALVVATAIYLIFFRG